MPIKSPQNNEIRIKLHKLRRSWTPEKLPAIFSKTELYRLDVRIRAHDSNWPVEGAPVVTKKPAPAPKPTPALVVKRPKTPEQVKIEAKPTPVVNPNHPKSDGIQELVDIFFIQLKIQNQFKINTENLSLKLLSGLSFEKEI